MRSWIGRCFAAIRLNEELAETLGIDVFRYKLLSFMIVATSVAAVAGACTPSTSAISSRAIWR